MNSSATLTRLYGSDLSGPHGSGRKVDSLLIVDTIFCSFWTVPASHSVTKLFTISGVQWRTKSDVRKTSTRAGVRSRWILSLGKPMNPWLGWAHERSIVKLLFRLIKETEDRERAVVMKHQRADNSVGGKKLLQRPFGTRRRRNEENGPRGTICRLMNKRTAG